MLTDAQKALYIEDLNTQSTFPALLADDPDNARAVAFDLHQRCFKAGLTVAAQYWANEYLKIPLAIPVGADGLGAQFTPIVPTDIPTVDTTACLTAHEFLVPEQIPALDLARAETPEGARPNVTAPEPIGTVVLPDTTPTDSVPESAPAEPRSITLVTEQGDTVKVFACPAPAPEIVPEEPPRKPGRRVKPSYAPLI